MSRARSADGRAATHRLSRNGDRPLRTLAPLQFSDSFMSKRRGELFFPVSRKTSRTPKASNKNNDSHTFTPSFADGIAEWILIIRLNLQLDGVLLPYILLQLAYPEFPVSGDVTASQLPEIAQFLLNWYKITLTGVHPPFEGRVSKILRNGTQYRRSRR